MDIILQFIYSFFATSGFSIYFSAPLNSIIPSGISGAISWSIYYYIIHTYNSKIIAIFLGSFIVGVLGEVLAIKYKKPATVFIIPGIVPLVPGAGMYYTMLALVENDFIKAASFGTETLFAAAAIAIGIIISTSFSRSIRSFKKAA
ncbi:threonine/serine exporter family protein [Wansuia hejianensis]|uniref:Threonine/serine exporter family protein n=1 Tax=Wansuia hejianensis TaxID=2763667 RepID=A0A926IN83_9FIRM|nr:threonine/serine exporter family protein [Wansuia hejianensis]MBC8590428.1 threonine/serine exporter family protein [Wansuia hejianensis]